MPLLLNEAAVASVLRMADLIPLMRTTLAEFSSGGAVQPVRTAIQMPAHESLLASMPGYLPKQDALAVKVVTLSPRNAGRGIPTHLATILLHDPATGELLALLDGRLVTEMRTAAVSAAAADALARKDAKTLALIGTGVQAQSHLEALRLVRAFERVRVWSPNAERREAFAREHSSDALPVEVEASAEATVQDADVIVTATSSREPVVRGEWVSDGTCLLAVGACVATWRELDGDCVRRASVFVDSLAAAKVEAGDLLQAEREGSIGADHVRGEIGAVFAGTLAGRTSEREVTLFKSLGLAVEDAATAKWVYERAKAAGLGQSLEL